MGIFLGDHGLVKKAGFDLAASLKQLLANTDTLYHRAHGFHWNVRGDDFYEYHEFFEEIYTDLYGSIDPIAENIRKLGQDSPYRLVDMINLRTIQETEVTYFVEVMLTDLLVGINTLLECLNMCISYATMENQQGVLNFLAGRVEMTQKWQWQLTVSLQYGELGENNTNGI